MIGRGLETLAKRYGGGAEVWQLKDVLPELKLAIGGLQDVTGTLPAQCCQCRASKPTWSGRVADAGQMFEAISARDVTSAAKYILGKASAATGQQTVTVLRTVSRRAYTGGASTYRSDHTSTFSHDELLACLSAFCQMDLVSIAGVTARASVLMDQWKSRGGPERGSRHHDPPKLALGRPRILAECPPPRWTNEIGSRNAIYWICSVFKTSKNRYLHNVLEPPKKRSQIPYKTC